MYQTFCGICRKPISTELHQVGVSSTEPSRHFDFCGDCAFPVMLFLDQHQLLTERSKA